MTRYSPFLVGLHWIMAVLILLALAAGGLMLDPLANDSPEKPTALAAHMSLGMIIGALLLVRIAVKLRSANPPHADTGSALLDGVGIWTHRIFYVLIAGMVLSGLGIAATAGLFPIAFGDAPGPVPDAIDTVPPRAGHGLLATLLALLIALHVAAALYHALVLRDGLMRRMWFGRN